MKTRFAEQKDIEALSKLFDAYRMFYGKETDPEGAKAFLMERILKHDSVIYVSESEEGELLGFVQLYPLFSSTRMKKFWLLNDLFVGPTHRGKGISIALINCAKELVKKTEACGIFLETEKSNLIGNKLYPKTGFVLNEASNFYEWNV